MTENLSGLTATDDFVTNEKITPEPKIEEVVETAEIEEVQEQDTEGKEVLKKKPSGFHKSIERERRKAAEREAVIKAEYEAKLAALAPSKPIEAKLDNNSEPKLEDYTDWNSWKAVQEKQQQQEASKNWQQKIDELVDSDPAYEDYDEIVGKYKNTTVHPTIIEALAEHGPELAHYLGKNDLVEELNGKSSLAVAREIDKILPLLRNQKASPVKISKAPAPIRTVPGSVKSDVSLKDMSTDDFIAARMNRKK